MIAGLRDALRKHHKSGGEYRRKHTGTERKTREKRSRADCRGSCTCESLAAPASDHAAGTLGKTKAEAETSSRLSHAYRVIFPVCVATLGRLWNVGLMVGGRWGGGG